MPMSEGVWKALDIVVKGIGAAVIAAGITFYGIRAESAREEIAEANTRVTSLIEFASKQKDLDVNVGLRMFETLMSNYLRKGGSGERAPQVRDKLLLLRMMALNFQDVPINLKPLFEDLDRELTNRKEKEELREIGKEVARRQAFRMTFVNGFDSGLRTVKSGDEVSFPNLPFVIRVKSVGIDGVEASVVLEDRGIGPFTVSYFDMPIVDNVKIGDSRVALLLVSSSGREADMRVVAFESDLAADRFDVKEMTRSLRQKRIITGGARGDGK